MTASRKLVLFQLNGKHFYYVGIQDIDFEWADISSEIIPVPLPFESKSLFSDPGFHAEGVIVLNLSPRVRDLLPPPPRGRVQNIFHLTIMYEGLEMELTCQTRPCDEIAWNDEERIKQKVYFQTSSRDFSEFVDLWKRYQNGDNP